MQIVAGSASLELAKEIAQILNCELIIPELKVFYDGEQYLRISDDVNQEVLVVQSLNYPQSGNLFELLNLVYTLKRLGAKKISTFTPYLCYARSDREVLPGEAISIDTVIKLLESTGIDTLYVADVHNPGIAVSSSIKIVNIYPIDALKSHFNNHDLDEFQVVAPDEGAKTRAKIYADALGVSYSWLEKHRDPVTGEVSIEIGPEPIEKTKIVLVDDIMSSGESLIKAASLLKLYGVTEIHIFVTHALGTSVVDKLSELGQADVISTNSIPSIISKLSLAQDLVRSL